jgi:hypothetical protein
MAFSFRLGVSTVRKIVLDTCEIIWDVLQPLYLAKPDEDQWRDIAERFQECWDFPNCVGSIDGKHITIQNPPNSGSLFHNYKKFFSIVLMAVVDADYRFTLVDVGAPGSNSDGGVFSNTKLGQMFMDGKLDIPDGQKLPEAEDDDPPMPFVLIGDEAFPSKFDLLRPYSKHDRNTQLPDDDRVFNLRLSRARRVVENAFGILTQRWRLYYNGRIQLLPQNAIKVVQATLVLHNFLMRFNTAKARVPHVPNCKSLAPTEPERLELKRLRKIGINASGPAKDVRDAFRTYFNSVDGAVEWQDRQLDIE